MAYTLTQAQYRNAKRALTIATKSGEEQNVINVVRRAREMFEIHGYPDDWTIWRCAVEDLHTPAGLAEAQKWND